MLSQEKQKKLAYVARRYYLEDQRQSDIAKELGVSRPLISRMLSEARELGVVEITIHEPGARRENLMERLRSFHAIQSGVLVEDGKDEDETNRALSQGAVELLQRIGTRRLGVGWGYLIGQLVTWLEENPQRDSAITDICPLVGNASIPARNYQSNENVRLMARQLGADPRFLYLPALPDSLEEKHLRWSTSATIPPAQISPPWSAMGTCCSGTTPAGGCWSTTSTRTGRSSSPTKTSLSRSRWRPSGAAPTSSVSARPTPAPRRCGARCARASSPISWPGPTLPRCFSLNRKKTPPSCRQLGGVFREAPEDTGGARSSANGSLTFVTFRVNIYLQM